MRSTAAMRHYFSCCRHIWKVSTLKAHCDLFTATLHCGFCSCSLLSRGIRPLAPHRTEMKIAVDAAGIIIRRGKLARIILPVRLLALGFSRLLRHSSDMIVFSSCLTKNFGPAISSVIVVGSTTICRVEKPVTSGSRWGKFWKIFLSFRIFCEFL